MRSIEQVHIELPDGEMTLCGLSADRVWQKQEDAVLTLEEAVEEELYIPEDERCDICWRDEDARTLMLLANIG